MENPLKIKPTFEPYDLTFELVGYTTGLMHDIASSSHVFVHMPLNWFVATLICISPIPFNDGGSALLRYM